MRQKVIAVIGASRAQPTELALARHTGALIAREGFGLVTGGLGGVMEAASQGARESGGWVLGILPGSDPDAGNPFLHWAVATGSGDGRNAVIANTADAFVAIGGSYGTLSEMAFGLKREKMVVGLSSWRLDTERSEGAPWVEVDTPQAAMCVLREHFVASRAP